MSRVRTHPGAVLRAELEARGISTRSRSALTELGCSIKPAGATLHQPAIFKD